MGWQTKCSYTVLRGVTAGYFLTLTYFTVAPDPWWILGRSGRGVEESVDLSFPDVLQHGAAYAGLGFLLTSAMGASTRPMLRGAALAALHGGVTELVQGAIPLRTCDWTDAVANIAGAILGAMLAGIILRGLPLLRIGSPAQAS